MSDKPLTLTAEELEDLTRKRRPSAQARVLNGMGIEFKYRGDGSLAVDREHYEQIMGGGTPKRKRAPKPPPQINWDD
jgi:hypothetical protein